MVCPVCDGSGKLLDKVCPLCDGEEAPMTIFIDASLTGNQLTTAEVEASDTCAVLRKAAEESAGSWVKLIFGSVVLEDTMLIADQGIWDGAHVLAMISKPPLEPLFSNQIDISVAEDFNEHALRLELDKIEPGYRRVKKNCGVVQFGPTVPLQGVAEWCLHILERCDDGQLDFGLVDCEWIRWAPHYLPHYRYVEKQMVGARASWEESTENGKVLIPFSDKLHCETPPWVAGCKISLRLERGSFCITHHSADGTVTSSGYVEIDCIPHEDFRVSVYRYFYEREGGGDDVFVLERVE